MTESKNSRIDDLKVIGAIVMRFEEYSRFHKNEKTIEQELFRLIERVEMPENEKGRSFFAALKKKIMLLDSAS